MASHPFFEGLRSPRILAHRGLVTDEMREEGIAENSVAAIAAAHAAGADIIESDCHLTADGVVVLFHDDNLQRVAGDPRPLADVTFAELEDLMATRGGLATLAQALGAFPESRFNIDVKAAAAAIPAGRIVAEHANRVLLTSFSDSRRAGALAAAKQAGGSPATSAGYSVILRLAVAVRLLPVPRLLARILRGIDALRIPERRGPVRVLTPGLVRAAHANGVEVHVWTVNDVDEMRRLLAMGVDGIVTDIADQAVDAR
jgi:glycerophosphoryl diester phosphodiesterase